MATKSAKTSVAPLTTALPGYLQEALPADAGGGLSPNSSDYARPNLRIVQSGSPILTADNAKHLAEAKPGDWAIVELGLCFDGSEGLVVQHCGQINTWSEFLPDRQGFVARHLTKPDDTEAHEGRSRRPVLIRRSTGNLIIETRELYLLTHDGIACVFFASSTQHQFARLWMLRLAQIRDPKNPEVKLPSYATDFRLTTTPKSNAFGRWYGPVFHEIGLVEDEARYLAAREFQHLVASGAVRIAGNAGDDC
jgi:hypothetical protein